MSDESPTLGTRLLFAVIGSVLGGLGGMFAEEYVTTVDPTMLIIGGAAVGFVLGFLAPRLVEVIAQLS